MCSMKGGYAAHGRRLSSGESLSEKKTGAGNRSCTRKTFIAGLSAFAASGRLFADLGVAPNLRLGVVSDIHFLLEPKTRKLRKDWDEATFVHALKYFRERKVDAVVVADRKSVV